MGWVTPLCAASLAMLDDDHRVQLSVVTDGAKVVLAHDASDPAKSPWHEHCAVSATLVALSPDADGPRDHVLSFPSGITLDRSSGGEEGVKAPEGPEFVQVSWRVPGCAFSRVSAAPLREALMPMACVVVRTTVLLC